MKRTKKKKRFHTVSIKSLQSLLEGYSFLCKENKLKFQVVQYNLQCSPTLTTWIFYFSTACRSSHPEELAQTPNKSAEQ